MKILLLVSFFVNIAFSQEVLLRDLSDLFSDEYGSTVIANAKKAQQNGFHHKTHELMRVMKVDGVSSDFIKNSKYKLPLISSGSDAYTEFIYYLNKINTFNKEVEFKMTINSDVVIAKGEVLDIYKRYNGFEYRMVDLIDNLKKSMDRVTDPLFKKSLVYSIGSVLSPSIKYQELQLQKILKDVLGESLSLQASQVVVNERAYTIKNFLSKENPYLEKSFIKQFADKSNFERLPVSYNERVFASMQKTYLELPSTLKDAVGTTFNGLVKSDSSILLSSSFVSLENKFFKEEMMSLESFEQKFAKMADDAFAIDSNGIKSSALSKGTNNSIAKMLEIRAAAMHSVLTKQHIDTFFDVVSEYTSFLNKGAISKVDYLKQINFILNNSFGRRELPPSLALYFSQNYNQFVVASADGIHLLDNAKVNVSYLSKVLPEKFRVLSLDQLCGSNFIPIK